MNAAPLTRIRVESWPELNQPRNISTRGRRSFRRGRFWKIPRERLGPAGPSPSASRPPARPDPRFLRATALSTVKPQYRVPRRSTWFPPPPKALPNSPSDLKDLSTRLPQLLSAGSGPRSPAIPSEELPSGSDARLPFLLLVSCHCRCGPSRLGALGLPSRWGCSRRLRCGTGPLSEDPVGVKGARKPESPAQSGGSLRAAG